MPPSLPPTHRLADRLAAARRKHFVGRAAELELFRARLKGESAFAVLHIFGPGGVGKTTLLREFGALAEEDDARVVRLDARNVDAAPSSFLASVRAEMNLDDDADVYAALGVTRTVLFLDTYELLSPLDGWLREQFLPQLPDACFLVLAGRNALDAAWRGDAGWQELVRTVALRNLRPEESEIYLRGRGLPTNQIDTARDSTHGHPLALALVAEIFAQADTPHELELTQQPDIMRALLQRFIAHTPSLQHRRALEVCAHVRVTTEASLRAALEVNDAREFFEWLRGLSFIEQNAEGLFPHDLARDVLDADLQWRNPEAYYALRRRWREYLLERAYTTQGIVQQRVVMDLLYLHRTSRLMKEYYVWRDMGSVYVENARLQDHAAILEIVEQHEGAASAQIAAYWLRAQPQHFVVVRDANGVPLGFGANLILTSDLPHAREIDAGLDAVWNFVLQQGGLRAGQQILLHRFVMTRDAYQLGTPLFNPMQAQMGLLWMTMPQLAWCFVIIRDKAYWEPLMQYMNLPAREQANFQVGDATYHVFAHDWRAEPLSAWLDMMQAREMTPNFELPTANAQLPAPLLVLSQPEFEQAARQALKDLHNPAALAQNPLTRSRVVLEQRGTNAANALEKLLHEAIQALEKKPRDKKLQRAVWLTYFEPTLTQEQAAEQLNIPFSTFRYHLTNGVERIVAWLWARETAN